MNDESRLNWIEAADAQVWSNHNTKKEVISWTVQLFIEHDGKRICIQPTCVGLREAIDKAIAQWKYL